VFTSLGNVQNIGEYTIELNNNIDVDQRRYNACVMGQVAAIWLDGNDPQKRFDRSIVIYGKSMDPNYIRAYHGCYDPLAYPLFFLVVRLVGKTSTDKLIEYKVPPPSNAKRKYTKCKRKCRCTCMC
jgi:hypothetical protein